MQDVGRALSYASHCRIGVGGDVLFYLQAHFDAVRAGLGQVAVITRATLKLIPAPEYVRRYVLTPTQT